MINNKTIEVTLPGEIHFSFAGVNLNALLSKIGKCLKRQNARIASEIVAEWAAAIRF